jgi:hypothetical protein
MHSIIDSTWELVGYDNRCILFYSILFYSILFYSIKFYSILFCSILFYSILSTLFYSILSILPECILFRNREKRRERTGTRLKQVLKHWFGFWILLKKMYHRLRYFRTHHFCLCFTTHIMFSTDHGGQRHQPIPSPADR